jgi:S-adenosylmethionine hydrolase
MILLFTDFGLEAPYVGQMKIVLARLEPDMPAIDLMHDVPVFDPKAGAYLLASLVPEMPHGVVVLAVVDPGVGSARRALAVKADGRWFLGPDNGLFEFVIRRAQTVQAYEIAWCPAKLSSSFHGRDLFAPVAASLSRGEQAELTPLAVSDIGRPDWPDDWAAIIYRDRFGNLITGLRAEGFSPQDCFESSQGPLSYRRTFSEAAPGEAFWYENSNGLVEFAVNQGNAGQKLGLGLGDEIRALSSR